MGSRTRAERLSWEHLVHSFQRSFLQNVLEKRVRLGNVEHCKRIKSSESSGEEEQQEHENREQQPRKRSKSIPSCKPASVDNRGWALARALRARARPFEVGASRSFLPAFLHPKRIRKTSKKVSKINPRRLEGFIKHLEIGHQKGVQNGSKFRPK